MTGESQNTLKKLADQEPYRHDLFVGLVSPLGSSRSQFLQALREEVLAYGYEVEHVRLADLLDSLNPDAQHVLPDRTDPGYYKSRMDAGDRLRTGAGDDSALAALAISQVARHREELAKMDRSSRAPRLFLFDSLKHPREAALLRSVYTCGFWLISLVQDAGERRQNLIEELSRQEGRADSVPEARAVELITRDESDLQSSHGQQVRDVFAAADFFLAIRAGENWRPQLARFLRGIFGAPFISPSADEEAMRIAHAAALRSTAIGRQVGAVIIPPAGAPILTGTNEVPRPGGGQYWEGDSPDHRDFTSGSDPNPDFTERVLREVFERLASARYFTETRNDAGGAAVLREATTPDESGQSVLGGTRAKSLIEFTRCLHAEQAAIVSAARTGVAIAGGRLYTTTLPCHECTKFIVGSGIIEVQYIEPYPKSLAGALYRELIDLLPPLQRAESRDSGIRRVPFCGFVGFGPHRYDEVFAAGQRRDGEQLARHEPSKACPIGAEWNEVGVRSKEDEVVLATAQAADRVSTMEQTASIGHESSPGETSRGASSSAGAPSDDVVGGQS